MNISTNVFRTDEEKNQELVQLLAERYLLRNALLRNGYEPIPTIGKETRITGWASGEITEDRILNETRRYSHHANTGLRTGRLVGIDIDLVDREQAATLREVTETVLGRTPLRRFGSKGEMLLYRMVDEPIGKMTIQRAKTCSITDNAACSLAAAGPAALRARNPATPLRPKIHRQCRTLSGHTPNAAAIRSLVQPSNDNRIARARSASS